MKLVFIFLISLFLFGCDLSDLERGVKIGEDVLDLFESTSFNEMNISSLNRSSISSYPEVFFCPNDLCNRRVIEILNSSKSSISCAFYELDYLDISNLLIEKHNFGVDISLVIDDRYLNEESILDLENAQISIYSDKDRGTHYNNYMHHKFCIIDNKKLLLSSANPTKNGLLYNDNNILFLESKELSNEFQVEFNQLVNGIFGYNKKQIREIKGIEANNDTFDIYFCPNDFCEDIALEILDIAGEEILFANFVLTLDSIEDLLIRKSELGVNVSGIIENRMYNSKGSMADVLDDLFDLTRDINPKTMHHKFFIVDSKYVITGSMNPSSSGVNYNDEFLLVINSSKIANEFKREFFRIKDLENLG